jgi:tRNA threonylcarbamoyl adenosine modification protein YeaZ
MTIESQITLGIESGIQGGSISLFRGPTEIDSWISSDVEKRTEQVIIRIQELLARNGIKKNELDQIGVSIGPGSYTGLKVGIATALGLKAALGITCNGISVLEAMSFLDGTPVEIQCAVPVGRLRIGRQTFLNGSPLSDPSIIAESDFISKQSVETGSTYILHESLYRMVAVSDVELGRKLVNAGRNMAHLVVRAVQRGFGQTELEPIFVTNPHG